MFARAWARLGNTRPEFGGFFLLKRGTQNAYYNDDDDDDDVQWFNVHLKADW